MEFKSSVCIANQLVHYNFQRSPFAFHEQSPVATPSMQSKLPSLSANSSHSSCPENIYFHFIASESKSPKPDELSRIIKTVFPSLDFKVYSFDDRFVKNLISYSIREALEDPLNYARIYLADILDSSVSRVIYLDSDIIVVDDIQKLWSVSLGPTTAIGAPVYCHANFIDRFCIEVLRTDSDFGNSLDTNNEISSICTPHFIIVAWLETPRDAGNCPQLTMAAEEEDEQRIVFGRSDGLIEWERLQLRPISDQFQFHSQSQSPPLSDPLGGGEVWSTIHEDYQPSVVFPPVNHEGIHLHLHHHQDVREIDTERSIPPSPISSPRARARPAGMAESVAAGWWDAGLEVLRFKFASVISFLRCVSASRGGSLRSHFPLAGSMVLLLLLYLRHRRRRRLKRESIIALISVIKEKDEKIHQLLHQIARMNELLLATHHGVPLISKAVSS
ncbi:hypothetical protein LXL04_031442 [Taraxacum kok-saghyz]